MGFQAKFCTILLIAAIFAAAPSTCSLDNKFKNGLEYFRQNLFQKLVEDNGQQKNIIVSPFSVQTCLAMVRLGAAGETATDMDRALGFAGETADQIADNYFSILSHYQSNNIMQLANKVYVSTGYDLLDSYKDILAKKFFSSAESINFVDNGKSAAAINSWAESQTNNQIKNIIAPNMLSSDTRLVLVNAVHFKGEWVKPFVASKTVARDFFMDETTKVQTPMMNTKDHFEYGFLDELNALAIRLPYKDSDLSMLIILPQSRTGLSAMEQKLKNIKLEDVTKKMRHMTVQVSLPKFKAEFQIDMLNVLKELGMKKILDGGDFSKMLKNAEPLTVSAIVHKAFIEVNEQGTEAAAATAAVADGRSMPMMFIADHPFYYAIVNTDNVVLFQGNVVRF